MFLAILGRYIESTRFCTGKICMFIHISGRQINNLRMLSAGSVTGCGRYCSAQRWRRLSMSVGRRYTCSFTFPACRRILYSAILARKETGHMVLTKLSRVACYCSLHIVILQNLNTPNLFISDLSPRYRDQLLLFLHCTMWNPTFGHFSHIQGQVHVGLYLLYTIPLPCHCGRPVEYLQGICCCFK